MAAEVAPLRGLVDVVVVQGLHGGVFDNLPKLNLTLYYGENEYQCNLNQTFMILQKSSMFDPGLAFTL